MAERFVSNAFVAEVAVGLASGQDIPDQFQQTTRHCYNRLVAMQAFLQFLKTVLPEWIGLHRSLGDPPRVTQTVGWQRDSLSGI